MAAPLLAGLARIATGLGRGVARSGAKKLAVRKIKSVAKDKVKLKAKDKLSKKSKLLSSKGDQQEQKLKYSSVSGELTPTLTGTTDPVKIKSAPSSKSQVEQLKINVTNIHSFLVKSNKQYKKQEADTRRNETVQRSKVKLRGEERRLEKRSSPLAKSASIVKGAMQPAKSLFDRLMDFAGALLLGILVNALPAIVKKVKEIVDNIVNFLTPIQSGFNLVKGFFTGDLNESKYDVDKKRFSDGMDNINEQIDKVSEKMGPLGEIIKIFKPVVDLLGFGGKKVVLAKQDGKEGFLNKETGAFTEKQFTSEERTRYESGVTVSGENQSNQTSSPETTGSGGDGEVSDLSGIGDGREDMPVPLSGGILEGARKIIGMGKGTADQCANTTRAALRKAGHPMADVRTMIGDLDTPQGIAYNAPSFAASFGGSDMGQVIKNKSSIKAGDIILWRADRDLGGILNKGAITHVGIAADDGLKHQFDHNRRSGFHYRRHWSSSGGTSWFAGIRLGSGRGSSKMKKPSLSTNTQGSGDARASLSNPENKTKVNQIASINQSMDDDEGTTTIAVQQVNTIQTQVVPTPVQVASAPPQPAPLSQLTSLWTL